MMICTSRQIPWLLLLLALVAGCKQGAARPAVYPVSGKLLVNGKPAAGAQVILVPLAVDPNANSSLPWKQNRPTAVVEASGSFQPSTFELHDGAPAGEYAVTVTWPTVTVDNGEEIPGPDRLQGRYSRPAQPAAKATIQAGPNELPVIDLK